MNGTPLRGKDASGSARHVRSGKRLLRSDRAPEARSPRKSRSAEQAPARRYLLEVAHTYINHHQCNDAEDDAGVIVVPTDTLDAVDRLNRPIANINHEWKQRA